MPREIAVAMSCPILRTVSEFSLQVGGPPCRTPSWSIVRAGELAVPRARLRDLPDAVARLADLDVVGDRHVERAVRPGQDADRRALGAPSSARAAALETGAPRGLTGALGGRGRRGGRRLGSRPDQRLSRASSAGRHCSRRRAAEARGLGGERLPSAMRRGTLRAKKPRDPGEHERVDDEDRRPPRDARALEPQDRRREHVGHHEREHEREQHRVRDDEQRRP